MGAYSKALLSYEKALEIQQKTLPPNQPALAVSYNNNGLVYENMGDHVKARSFFERAVGIAQQSLLSDHPNVKKCRNDLDRIRKKF